MITVNINQFLLSNIRHTLSTVSAPTGEYGSNARKLDEVINFHLLQKAMHTGLRYKECVTAAFPVRSMRFPILFFTRYFF